MSEHLTYLLNLAYAETLAENPDIDTIRGCVAEAKAIIEGETYD